MTTLKQKLLEIGELSSWQIKIVIELTEEWIQQKQKETSVYAVKNYIQNELLGDLE